MVQTPFSMSVKSKIRVLRIINRFNLGGPTYNAAYLTKYLDDKYETLLVGGAKDESEASSTYILDNLGLRPRMIENMKRSISLKDISAYNELDAIIKEFQPDIVHTHASKAGTLGRLAAIRNDVPVIVHTFHGHVFHSYFGKLKTAFYKGIERWLAARSSKIIAISEIQKDELGSIHRICSPKHISVIPLGFDLSRFAEDVEQKRLSFREKYELQKDDLAIVIVGRLVPVKNHKMFIRVVKRLIETGTKNARFFIVGDGESKGDLTKFCDEISVSYHEGKPPTEANPVCFTSWIKEVDWVYAGSDIVCLTSLNEGTPVSLIEAQAASQPIVTTRVGGIHNVVLENESAFLTESNEVDDFASKIGRLIDDEDLRKKMGKAGMSRAVTTYSYTRLCSDVDHLYSSLMKKKTKI